MRAESYKHYYLSMPYAALPYKASSIVLTVYAFSIIVLARVPGLNKTSQFIGFGLAFVFTIEFLLTRQRVLWLPGEMLGFLGFVVWVSLGVLWARQPQSVFVLTMTLFQLVGLSIICFNILMARRSYMPLAVGLFAGLVVASIQAFRESPEIIGGFYARVSSTQIDPNQYALSLGVGIVTAWFVYTEKSNPLFRLCLIALILLFAYQIVFFTGSRTGIVSIFVMLSIYSGVREFSKTKFSAARILFTFVSMIIFYFLIGKIVELSPYSYRFENIQNSTHLQVRTQMATTGFHWWFENPIIGYGAAGYSYLWGGSFSHNNYIELLVNYGLIGFMLYYTTVFKLIKNSIRAHSAAALKTNTLSWIIMTISVLLFWDLTLVNYYQKTYWLLFSLVMTLNFSAQKYRGAVGIAPYAAKAERS